MLKQRQSTGTNTCVLVGWQHKDVKTQKSAQSSVMEQQMWQHFLHTAFAHKNIFTRLPYIHIYKPRGLSPQISKLSFF